MVGDFRWWWVARCVGVVGGKCWHITAADDRWWNEEQEVAWLAVGSSG